MLESWPQGADTLGVEETGNRTIDNVVAVQSWVENSNLAGADEKRLNLES